MTSVLIAITFIVLVLSGVILFVSPPGRVANWGNWTMLGLTKRDWSGLHVWFATVFLVAAIFHLVFNLRPLLGYCKDRLTRRLGFRWEWAVALALCGVVFGGTRAGVPPFSSLLNFSEGIKKSWEDPRERAPIPHAELLTLKELAEKAGVSMETAVQRLEERNFKGIVPEIVVENLAQTNQMSAQQIYQIIQGTRGRGWGGGGHGKSQEPESGGQTETSASHREGSAGPGGRGGGTGWKTLAEYCASSGIDLKQAATRLEAKGIKFASDRTLRDIASDNGYDKPYELLDVIEGRK